MSGAVKYDQDKPRLDLLPFEALVPVGRVLAHGAQKYSPNNWRRGMAWSRLLASALRHIFAWAAGDELDRETGESHIAHALCCLLFLMTYIVTRTGKDDRAHLGEDLMEKTGLAERLEKEAGVMDEGQEKAIVATADVLSERLLKIPGGWTVANLLDKGVMLCPATTDGRHTWYSRPFALRERFVTQCVDCSAIAYCDPPKD